MRGGDWYGNTVNVAARLADQAEPNEALISYTTHSAAQHDSSLRSSNEFLLHGVEHPVVAWRLSRPPL
jgi:class 3 adenylate cyclase